MPYSTWRLSAVCGSLPSLSIARHGLRVARSWMVVAGRALARLCTRAPSSEGQDLIEYALLATLLAIGAMAAVATFGDMVNQVWRILGSDLGTALGLGGL